MDKDFANFFFPSLPQFFVESFPKKTGVKYYFFYASVKSASSFHASKTEICHDWGVYSWVAAWLRNWIELNSGIIFTLPPVHICSRYMYMHSVAGCHQSPCLLEPLKFQPLLCRGVPLFEASFSCQCFVEDGERAFWTAHWWGRVHLDSNGRLGFTSIALSPLRWLMDELSLHLG